MKWIILIAACVLAVGCMAQKNVDARPDVATDVLGRWRVVRVFCPTCDRTDQADNGTVIELGKMNLVNPFGGDCAEPPGYDLLKVIPTDALIKNNGRRWSKQMINAIQSQRFVTYGYVTCNAMNHMRMIFVGKDRAYYLWEGDRVFVLARK